MYQNIYPQPANVRYCEGRFTFEKEVTLEISRDFGMEDSLPLLAELWKNFTCGVCKLNIKRTDRTGDFLWTIGEPALVELSEGVSYIVRTDDKGIAIKGENDLALLYGFYTLLQIICPVNLHHGEECFAVNCGQIEDVPQLKFRCMHLSVSHGVSLHHLRKYIRFAAFMKFSHIILEYFGTLKFDCLAELSWPDAYSKEEIRPLLKEANLMGIEVIPLFNSLGHAGMGSLMDCKHVVLDQNPRLALLFEPTGWSFCISNPEARNLIRAASNELLELCGPGSYFHMGLDESHDFASCDLCSGRNKGDYLAEFVNDTAKEMRQKGRRTMIWADMLLARKQFDPEWTYRTQKHFPVANATDELPTHKALDKIDRDVIIVDWQYYTDSKENETAKHISSHGFEVVTASYDDFNNMQLLAENAGKNNYFGYMSTAWGKQRGNADLMLYSADVAWSGKDAGKLDAFRLEARFYAVANLQRKLLPTSVTYQTAGWN